MAPPRSDPVLSRITAPGEPFEIGPEGALRVFKSAPPNLDAMIESARRHGAAVFIVDGDRRLTYDDVFALRDALAAQLAIEPGARVAIAMRNCAAWMIAFLAVIRAGGAAVLVNSRTAGAEMRAAIADCEAVLVLADGPRAAALREAGHAGPILESDEFPIEGEAPPPRAAAPSDLAAILFTSGTTGRSKGAELTHANLVTGLMCVQLSGVMVLENLVSRYGVPAETLLAHRPQPAGLLVFPLFHISGLGAGFLSPMLAGGKIVVMRRWRVEDARRLVREETISNLTAVPTMLWDLLQGGEAAGGEMASLTSISSGGQGLPLNLLDMVRSACPEAMMGTGYGLTETTGAVAMAIGEDFLRKPASSGRVLPLVDIRTLDDDGGVLAEGEIGEIAVRGPMVMRGYWNRPRETAEVLSDDGWFRTGDIGYVDDEGYVFIVDRKKDMVISGGENIYCAEVERAISQIPVVEEVAAFGLPDERMGERLVAVVVAAALTEAAVQAHVTAHLAQYKSPTRVVFAGEPLPRNATGKIDKTRLKAAWPRLSGEAG